MNFVSNWKAKLFVLMNNSPESVLVTCLKAIRMLLGGGEANTAPATAIESMPGPT